MTVSEPTPLPDRSAEPTAAADLSLHAAEERFIEAMGLMHEEDRLPRIAGRLVGLLILSPDPVRFDHLAERLRVSRASISTNTRLLENMGVIQRVTRPGDRRDYFQINQEPGLLLRIVDRFRARQASAEEMKQALLPEPGAGGIVAERLDWFIRFYSTLADSLNSVLAAMASRDGNSRPDPA
ncbi:MAG: MarR family transcriptional regulator [Holophagales bacterium]|nr:MarR family transcriptional regulator [Holophagales bacterium]MYH25946.1 MarR family transcriptional regulator [Holophagales bacterium]